MHPNGQVKETLLVVTDICVPEVEPQALSWEEQHQALAVFIKPNNIPQIPYNVQMPSYY